MQHLPPILIGELLDPAIVARSGHTPSRVATTSDKKPLDILKQRGGRLMQKFEDCTGREVKAGDRVGVAFSYSRASVGYIRIGKVESLDPFHMRWEADDKVSPVMVYNSHRMVIL
jgi:hypothetical protein